MKALIFDVDGTLADTEGAHRQAFNAAFREVGLDWHWHESLYTRLLAVTGGKERLHYYWRLIDPEHAGGSRVEATIDAVHAIKTRHYDALVGAGQLPLRPGILRLIREARDAGLAVAIATTTTPANVDALLRTPLGSDWRALFAAVCDAGSAVNKKPAPDVYLAALAELKLRGGDCLAFEDSENGLRAACAAGVATVVTPTAYTRAHAFGGALMQLPHLGDPDQPLDNPVPGNHQRWVDLAALRSWHAGRLNPGTYFEAA
ncbi:MAG: cbbY [Massilia sp.]|nr:cbbY [Massilia sp.]MDB5949111.1 cbbY [Massilia sp.]